MRRLPIYFLIDVSESMIGEPIQQVQDGIASIIKELKMDPYALETVWISLIGFAGESKIITPLEDIITFYPPKIPIGSGTSLSKGLEVLMQAIDREITKTTYEVKGDWKPIVFLFTDGIPTDDTEYAMNRWNNEYRSKATMIIISIGDNTNFNLLGKLSDQVLLFKNTTANSYKEFFKWVTASIKATSEKIDSNAGAEITLGTLDNEVIEKIDLTKVHTVPDENVVVLSGRCSTNLKPYLVKFNRRLDDFGLFDLKTKNFRIEGAFKIDQTSYDEYSSKSTPKLRISASELVGNTVCPSCSNRYSTATCSCGGIHCIDGEGEYKCPWCNKTGSYGFSEGDFDMNRTLG